MARSVVAKSFRGVGNGIGNVTRRAVSYTPTDDITIRQWKFVGQRMTNFHFLAAGVEIFNDMETIEWEIRNGTGAPNHKPETGASNLLASGAFDFRFSSPWKLYRILEYTVNLSTGVELTGGEEYFFILKTPSDETAAYRPLFWADTYDEGDASEVDASIYCCEYDTDSSAWTNGDNTYNLQYTVNDGQAGETWHIVIDGNGYMQPDNMRGFQSRQIASGLAQSRGGQSEYSQLRYPYTALSQHDWFSGMGQLDVEDLHAYLYGLSLDTTVREQMTIGPKVHQTGVDNSYDSYEPTAYTARFLLDNEHSDSSSVVNYYAQKFTASASRTAYYMGIIAGKLCFRFQHTLQIAIFDESGGDPDTNLTGWKDMTNTWTTAWQNVYIGAGGQALTNGDDYFIVVRTDQDWGRLPEHRVVFDSDGSAPGGVAKYSADGAAWNNLSVSMPFKINRHVEELFYDVVDLDYGDVDDTGKLRCAAGKVVYAFNSGTGFWENISTSIEPESGETTATITDIIHFDDQLFVAQGYDNPIRVYDGTDWGPSTDTNVISGGEFEDGDDIDEWTDNAEGTLSSDAGTGHTGNAGKLLNDAGGGVAISSQSFTVTDGEWYELYVWQNNGGGTDATGKVQVGNAVGDASFYDSGALDNADWTELHALFQVTGTTMVVQLVAGDANTDYTLFDDVEIYLAPVAKYFHIGKGYLWKTDSENEVSHANLGMSWSDGIPVGTNLYEITGMINYSGRVLVGKENGMWDIDDSDISMEYYLFEGQEHPENCKGWAVFSGMLFIPMQDFRVWRWTGTNYSQVGPADTKSGPTANWPNKVNRFAASARYLYAAVEPQDDTSWNAYGGLSVYNGIGWIPIARHLESDKTSNAICITNEIGNEPRIWFAEGKRVDYVKMSDFTHNRYDDPDMDFDISGAMCVTSWWDGGLKDANKFWNRLTLIADIPDDTQIDVYFGTDGQDWSSISDFVLLGHVQPEDLDDNGEISLMFPDGLVAKSVQVVFHLLTWDEDKTPRIRAYNLETLVRQIPVDAYSFRVYLADDVTKMDGTTSSRSAEDMWEELKRTRDKDAPVTISFPGKSFRGVISNLNERTSRYGPEGTQEQRWDRVAELTAIEAK
jgi:hypothetical protein